MLFDLVFLALFFNRPALFTEPADIREVVRGLHVQIGFILRDEEQRAAGAFEFGVSMPGLPAVLVSSLPALGEGHVA